MGLCTPWFSNKFKLKNLENVWLILGPIEADFDKQCCTRNFHAGECSNLHQIWVFGSVIMIVDGTSRKFLSFHQLHFACFEEELSAVKVSSLSAIFSVQKECVALWKTFCQRSVGVWSKIIEQSIQKKCSLNEDHPKVLKWSMSMAPLCEIKGKK